METNIYEMLDCQMFPLQNLDIYNIFQQHDIKMLWIVQFFPNPFHQPISH
jgi:hypothetical protein